MDKLKRPSTVPGSHQQEQQEQRARRTKDSKASLGGNITPKDHELTAIMVDYIEVASNPMAPDAFAEANELKSQKLSNSDFRKLLMTPRVPAQTPQTDGSKNSAPDSMPPPDRTDRKRREATSARHKHKSGHKRHLGRSKREQSKENVSETSRYRDRAKERRDGKLVAPVEDGQDDREGENEDDSLARTADYRAVAPSSAAGESLAERRRMLIQESKYLGGDMEHTHLVKGLDYVLLQKVRLEIQNKELEAEKALDAELNKPEVNKEQTTGEEGVQFRTRVAANICDLLFGEKSVERNEYFQPGRMAYRIELEDDSVDFEVPATVIRSKSDCLQSDGRGPAAITTNEIVINKLTQILSYLRTGKRHSKKAKIKGRYGDKDDITTEPSQTQGHSNRQSGKGDDIYEGIGSEYVPTVTQRNAMSEADGRKESGQLENAANTKNTSGATDTGGRLKPSYFEVPGDVEPNAAVGGSVTAAKEFMNQLSQRFGGKDDEKTQEKASLERFFAKTKVTCYDECYPGFAESYDAMGDSDDEADFSKMDLGNKKGPVGRWDFETQEEYSDYMSNKEALPKAAFQYGVKMADGRRTRRIGPKDEKAELDRQLQQIQSIIQKRKQLAEDGGPVAKNPRF
ncbi:unnamed protein product [Calicophoron daubneyi]|uniref:Protein Red n=1 Tax=Calicophoron daubneyi TaxID=300641 RepID=A0AAV2THE7_CALDB